MQDFTVTVAGSERHDGHKPYTYVVTAEDHEDAAKKVLEHHRKNNEDADLVLVECFKGLPPRSGYAWNDLRPKLKYMVVTVNDLTIRKAVVPVLSILSDEEAEKLARDAVENCDSYGNIDAAEERVEITSVKQQSAFKKGSYIESSQFDFMPEEQLQAYAEAVLADPTLVNIAYEARRVLKVRKPGLAVSSAPAVTITDQQADQIQKYLVIGPYPIDLDKGKLLAALEQAGIKVI